MRETKFVGSFMLTLPESVLVILLDIGFCLQVAAAWELEFKRFAKVDISQVAGTLWRRRPVGDKLRQYI